MKRINKGFTLVELLAVIALIGILAGFVFPALRGARIQARIAATKTTITNLELAISSYFNDFGRYPDLSDNHPNVIGTPTPAGIPEVDNDMVMRLLTGRYGVWNPSPSPGRAEWRDDEEIRRSPRWNGPYIEPSETKYYTYKHDLDPNWEDDDGGRRFVYWDGWTVEEDPRWPRDGRWPRNPAPRMKTYFHFWFPGAQDNITRNVNGGSNFRPSTGDPAVDFLPTFNRDSFDIWSYGPDGAGQYYPTEYDDNASANVNNNMRIDMRQAYEVWEDSSYGNTAGSAKRLVNTDNIVNWE
jgi:prepilin-type N-terminal cleavage/methylation domain-containing protein